MARSQAPRPGQKSARMAGVGWGGGGHVRKLAAVDEWPELNSRGQTNGVFLPMKNFGKSSLTNAAQARQICLGNVVCRDPRLQFGGEVFIFHVVILFLREIFCNFFS